MPVQTPLNVYESCGAESLYYWADGWRLESFSSGSGEVEIADRWVMTALQKAIYSAVAGRSWPWYTTLCSRLLFPAMILSWLAKSGKSRALLRCMQMNVCQRTVFSLLENTLKDISMPVVEIYQSSLLDCVADQHGNHSMCSIFTCTSKLNYSNCLRSSGEVSNPTYSATYR